MSFTETVGHPMAGNLVLQHKDYKKNKWDLDYRAHKRVVRITEREDETGAWKVDPDAVGDLVLGLCWPNDKAARELPMWSFAFPSVISKKGGGGGTATQGSPQVGATFGLPPIIPGGTPTQGGSSKKSSGPMNVLPIADQKDSPDSRMKPLQVPVRTLKANGPQNPPPAPGGGGGGAGAAPVNPNQIENGSKTLYLGIGAGAVQQGFGGPGVGFGGKPGASFSGVRTNFSGGSPGATFSGTNTNFTGGKPGASFTDPTRAPGRP